jgi:signal transduction histidine kinase
MKSSSLRIRLLVLATLAVTVAMVLSAIGLTALFGRHVERRIGQELDTHILQLAGNLRFRPDGSVFLDAEPGDPRFERVFGGLYWQVIDETKARKLRSVSLWDAELPLPKDTPEPGLTHIHSSTGPDGLTTLVHERRITLEHANQDRPVRISVAINTAELTGLRTGFASDLVPAVIVLGLSLLAGLWWQVTQGLKPVSGLGIGVRAIRSGQRARLSEDVPSEIRPLVDEVNKLLSEQEVSLSRARDRAADLAHGLKTPLTALSSDVARLRVAGQDAVADDIEETATRMRQIVERELARSRIRSTSIHSKPVAVASAVHAIIRTLERTPQGEGKTFVNAAPADALAAVDINDLNDIFGNLIENAARAARSVVSVSAKREGLFIVCEVSDDGPGVPEQLLTNIAERGRRLDEASGSAGLGLNLVVEILSAYGSVPGYTTSALGGLGVSFTLPASA